jgi:hypothetical protein
MRQNKCAEIIAQEKALFGHCPVTLKDENRIEKGSNLTLVYFKAMNFVFSSQEKAAKFYLNPSRYSAMKLPTKMPPAQDGVSMFGL